jgi:non-ribosomal peptide synthetase-like protein
MRVLLLALALITAAALAAAAGPIHVAIVHRHGARTAAKFDGTFLDYDGTRLTREGALMSVNLGKAIRGWYGDLFGTRYNSTAIVSVSTDYERTIRSGYGVLEGLFNTTGDTYARPYLQHQSGGLLDLYKWGSAQLHFVTALNRTLGKPTETLSYLTPQELSTAGQLIDANQICDDAAQATTCAVMAEDAGASALSNDATLSPKWTPLLTPGKLPRAGAAALSCLTGYDNSSYSRGVGYPGMGLATAILEGFSGALADVQATGAPRASIIAQHYSAHDDTLFALMSALGAITPDTTDITMRLPDFAAVVRLELYANASVSIVYSHCNQSYGSNYTYLDSNQTALTCIDAHGHSYRSTNCAFGDVARYVATLNTTVGGTAAGMCYADPEDVLASGCAPWHSTSLASLSDESLSDEQRQRVAGCLAYRRLCPVQACDVNLVREPSGVPSDAASRYVLDRRSMSCRVASATTASTGPRTGLSWIVVVVFGVACFAVCVLLSLFFCSQRRRDEYSELEEKMVDDSGELQAVRPGRPQRFVIGLMQLLYFVTMNLLTCNSVGILTFASWLICDELAAAESLWLTLLFIIAAPFAVGVLMLYQHIVIIILRWIVFPWSPQPGMYPCDGLMFHRKILFDMMARVSLQYAHPMYSTLFTQYFLRAMGVKVGNRVECSNLFGWTPGLTTIGEECFVADFVGVNPADCFRGYMKLDHVTIGDRAFIGNGSVLPPGTVIGEKSLVGLLTCPMEPVLPGTTAIGSPAFQIPRRSSVDDVDQAKTFRPSTWLVVQRTIWEFFRTVVPASFVTYSAVLGYVLAAIIFREERGYLLHNDEGVETVVYVSLVFLYMWGILLFNVLFVAFTKWIIVGRHKVEENPLWSSGVWRSEFVVDVQTVVGIAGTINLCRGTPFLPMLFRLLGAKIGKGVYLDTLYLTEPDMVALGDGACVNYNTTLQTHLFEDRVMKLDTMVVGDRVSIGSMSVVLYNTHIGTGATIDSCTLVMKGESLPSCTHWAGIPAQKTRPPTILQEVVLEAAFRPPSPPHTASAIESNILAEERRKQRAPTSSVRPSPAADTSRGLAAAALWLRGGHWDRRD